MSKVDLKIPSVGESITEVSLGEWLVSSGDFVNAGDPLVEIESDKASLEIPALESGVITILKGEGDYPIGEKIAEIDTEASAGKEKKKDRKKSGEREGEEEGQKEGEGEAQDVKRGETAGAPQNISSPAARKILAEKNIDADALRGTGRGGRITKADALNADSSAINIEGPRDSAPPEIPRISSSRDLPPAEAAAHTASAFHEKSAIMIRPLGAGVHREKMTRLRRTIAKRLVDAKNQTAMLTTFNEVDMHAVMELRKRYKDRFKEKFDVNLGFMSFFTRAACLALREFPNVNAQIEGDEIVFYKQQNVGVAVSSERGLVVPVLRDAGQLSMAQIEKEILRLALKARDGKITVEEMSGGTFTITNGGIFGSMLSTPIINIPQSAILGMHNIVERPVAIAGEVKVRPIMYLALSYDHRLIDGKESVGFLKMLKGLIEDPSRILLDL